MLIGNLETFLVSRVSRTDKGVEAKYYSFGFRTFVLLTFR